MVRPWAFTRAWHSPKLKHLLLKSQCMLEEHAMLHAMPYAMLCSSLCISLSMRTHLYDSRNKTRHLCLCAVACSRFGGRLVWSARLFTHWRSRLNVGCLWRQSMVLMPSWVIFVVAQRCFAQSTAQSEGFWRAYERGLPHKVYACML